MERASVIADCKDRRKLQTGSTACEAHSLCLEVSLTLRAVRGPTETPTVSSNISEP